MSEAVGYPAKAWLGSLLVMLVPLSQLDATGARTDALPNITAVLLVEPAQVPQLVERTKSQHRIYFLHLRNSAHSAKRAHNSSIYTSLLINQGIEKQCPYVKGFCSQLW